MDEGSSISIAVGSRFAQHCWPPSPFSKDVEERDSSAQDSSPEAVPEKRANIVHSLSHIPVSSASSNAGAASSLLITNADNSACTGSQESSTSTFNRASQNSETKNTDLIDVEKYRQLGARPKVKATTTDVKQNGWTECHTNGYHLPKKFQTTFFPKKEASYSSSSQDFDAVDAAERWEDDKDDDHKFRPSHDSIVQNGCEDDDSRTPKIPYWEGVTASTQEEDWDADNEKLPELEPIAALQASSASSASWASASKLPTCKRAEPWRISSDQEDYYDENLQRALELSLQDSNPGLQSGVEEEKEWKERRTSRETKEREENSIPILREAPCQYCSGVYGLAMLNEHEVFFHFILK